MAACSSSIDNNFSKQQQGEKMTAETERQVEEKDVEKLQQEEKDFLYNLKVQYEAIKNRSFKSFLQLSTF